jgi:hypothetical protein
MARWFQFQNKTEAPEQPNLPTGTGIAIPNQVSVPVQYETRFQYKAQSDPTAATQFIQLFESTWHFPWSEPVKQSIAPRLAIALAVSGLIAPVFSPTIEPGNSYESTYHQPWSTPVRLNQFHPSRQDVSADVYLSTEIINADKWIFPWTDPVRFRVFSPHQQQSIAYIEPPAPIVTNRSPQSGPSDGGTPVSIVGKNFYDTISVKFGAFNATSFIVNSQTSILAVTSAQPANFVDITVTTPFGTSGTGAGDTFTFYDVTADMWFNPLSEPPVKTKSGLSANQQQFLALPSTTPNPQVVTSAVSSQVSYKTRFIYQTVAQPVVAAENITVDKWFVSWTDPVRFRPQLPAGEQQFLAYGSYNPVVNFSYYNWLTEPVRTRVAQQQQTIAIPATAAEVITYDKWGYARSEPARFKSFPTAEQQAFIGTTLSDKQLTDTFESRWHQEWSKPVRIKPALPTGEQQTLAFVQTVGEVITADKWSYPWSEPVRKKQALPVTEQQPFTAPIQPPNPQVIASALGSPVQYKVRFIYQSEAMGPVFPLPSGIIVTLNATETNGDVALFGVSVYNKAVKCAVSIKEIPVQRLAAASIVEVISNTTGQGAFQNGVFQSGAFQI